MKVDDIGIRQQRSLYKVYKRLHSKPKGEKNKKAIAHKKIEFDSKAIDLLGESWDAPLQRHRVIPYPF